MHTCEAQFSIQQSGCADRASQPGKKQSTTCIATIQKATETNEREVHKQTGKHTKKPNIETNQMYTKTN